MESERRQSERSDVFLIVEFRPLNKKTEFLQGVTENISREGFDFDSQSHSFNTGETLEFKLKHPQRDLSVSFSGEIIWKREAWYKSVTGVKFKDINADIENKITELKKELPGETLQDDIKAGPEDAEKSAAMPAESPLTSKNTDGPQGISINIQEPRDVKQQVNKEPATFDWTLKEERDRGKKSWLYISLAAVFIVVSVFVLSGRVEYIKQELTAFISSIDTMPTEDIDKKDIIAFRDEASPGSMAEPEPFEKVEVLEQPGTNNKLAEEKKKAEIGQKHLTTFGEDISPEITIKPEPAEPVQLNKIKEDHLPLSDLEANIAFGRNSDVVDPGFDSEIDKIANVLLNYSRAVVKVTGHTDSIGAGPYNLDLSIRRASSVKNLLVQRGINSSRIEIMGLGHLSPVAPNDTEIGRKRNRRVEIKITYPGM